MKNSHLSRPAPGTAPEGRGACRPASSRVNGNDKCTDFGNRECSDFGNSNAPISVTTIHNFR